MFKEYSLTVCLKRGTLSGIDICKLFDQWQMKILKIRLPASRLGLTNYTSALRNKLAKQSELTSLTCTGLYGGLDFHLDISTPAHIETHQCLHFTFNGNLVDWENLLVVYFLQNRNLVAIYLCSEEDEYLQSADVSEYTILGLSPPRDKIVIDKRTRIEYVDITQNSGRKVLVAGMWLMACWKMWFGKEYALKPQSHIANFKDAFEINRMTNGVIFVQLYENIRDFNLKENREKQDAFRKWLGMDEFELSDIGSPVIQYLKSDLISRS